MSQPTIFDRVPLEKQYAAMLAKMDLGSFNAGQSNPLGLPTGFFKVFTKKGEFAGYGHYCPKCKLQTGGLTETSEVQHCGKVTLFPTGLFSWLAKMRMPSVVAFARRYY